MNRDDIIRMAREAGGYRAAPTDKALLLLSESHLERFANLVAAAEREQCAKIVDKWFEGMSSEPEMAEIAAEIRARGNSEKP
jgi:hypothetical protein